jgi:hypothetical protein
LLDREARLEQHGEAPGDERELAGADAHARRPEEPSLARRRRFAVDRGDLDRHEARAAQPGACLARRFGLDHTAPRAAVGVDGDVAESGHRATTRA